MGTQNGMVGTRREPAQPEDTSSTIWSPQMLAGYMMGVVVFPSFVLAWHLRLMSPNGDFSVFTIWGWPPKGIYGVVLILFFNWLAICDDNMLMLIQ
jgi:hypothetical protein